MVANGGRKSLQKAEKSFLKEWVTNAYSYSFCYSRIVSRYSILKHQKSPSNLRIERSPKQKVVYIYMFNYLT